ncbi:NfeD family protein [Lutibaculum baratangense]|uniref:NfeD family protein n=1 Tax=Lutibaculum baratangense TaxID=1358440 RepID=UPI001FCBE205|nr:nodulation protein NfeD [Lutibaculum baratangense]
MLFALATLTVLGAFLFLSDRTLSAAQPAESGGTVLLLDVQGAIGPATTLFLRRGLDEAADRGAAAIVLRIDTPGGLVSSTRDIIRDLLGSPVPVIAYVAPSGARAASAGTYILYASHLAAMAPGTNVGAATPIEIGGGLTPGGEGEEEGEDRPSRDPASSKAVNDAVAQIRSLADIHGRNADWAEHAVRDAESLAARAALDENVIEILADDLLDLLAQADGRQVRVQGRDVVLRTADLGLTSLEPDWRTRLLAAITDPNIAYILMLIGIYGIILEFWNPGTIFSGVIGAIALVVALFALNMLPVSYAGGALLFLGLALMAAEAFVPSFGILGIGGAVAFALGSVFLFEDVPGFALSPAVIAVATAVTAGFLILGFAAVARAYRRRVVTGDETLPDEPAEVIEWSGTSGSIHVHGERWKARSDASFAAGDHVRVIGREGLVLVVEPEQTTPNRTGDA